MVCTWFDLVCYASCLHVLPCPAWVLLSYVLQTIFLYPVHHGRLEESMGEISMVETDYIVSAASEAGGLAFSA